MGAMNCCKCLEMGSEIYSEKFGYICKSCFKEMEATNPESMADVLIFLFEINTADKFNLYDIFETSADNNDI